MMQLRTHLGLSRREFAEEIDTHPKHLADIERNARPISAALVERIYDRFGPNRLKRAGVQVIDLVCGTFK